MKVINQYITEKLHINNTTKIEYMYHPKTKDELIECIENKIYKEGLGTENNPLDLNDIDTSKITDMSHLFDQFDKLKKLSKNGYFDISGWDVSNVENMIEMFAGSHFKGDISKWDVSNVKYMNYMFENSEFNGDISDWNVRNVLNMRLMFNNCKNFNCNLDKWNPVNVKDASGVFLNSPLKIIHQNGIINKILKQKYIKNNMKNLKDFINEAQYSMPNLSGLKYDLSKMDVYTEITNVFDDEWDTDLAQQTEKLFKFIDTDAKFANIGDSDEAWAINDVIQFAKGKAKKLAAISGYDNEPTAELYKIDNMLIIQVVGDDDLTTYITK